MTPFADPLHLAAAALTVLSNQYPNIVAYRCGTFEVGRMERLRPGPLLVSFHLLAYILPGGEEA